MPIPHGPNMFSWRARPSQSFDTLRAMRARIYPHRERWVIGVWRVHPAWRREKDVTCVFVMKNVKAMKRSEGRATVLRLAS